MRQHGSNEGLRVGLWLALVVCAVGVLAASLAFGHEAETGWRYPAQCCNWKDCRHLEPVEVEVTQHGYFLPDIGPNGTLVRFTEANTSPDGQYHVCVRDYTYMDWPEVRVLDKVPMNYEDRMNRSPVCFWAPEGAV